ncbi:MAG: hypothetical protein HQL88_00565 [Magnetococcales bacterium]|nr:hypothetical protein [Magnetococcales bacterium]
MNGFRPGQKVRRIMQAASSAWWRRSGRSLLSHDRHRRFRVRSALFAHRAEHNQGAKGATAELSSPRRTPLSPPKWRVIWRAWWGGLAESSLLRLVELFIIMRNGIGFLHELWLVGQELLARRLSLRPVDLHAFKQEVAEGRLQRACQAQARGRPWERREPEENNRLGGALLQPVALREEVERAKISFLDIEEEDLAEEELLDQAGALRSRLAAVSHEVDKQ